MQLRLGDMLALAFAHGFLVTTVHMRSGPGVFGLGLGVPSPLCKTPACPPACRSTAACPAACQPTNRRLDAQVLSVEQTQNATKQPGQFLTIHLSAATEPQVLGVAQVLQAASAQRRENLGSWLQAWKDTRGQV